MEGNVAQLQVHLNNQRTNISETLPNQNLTTQINGVNYATKFEHYNSLNEHAPNSIWTPRTEITTKTHKNYTSTSPTIDLTTNISPMATTLNTTNKNDKKLDHQPFSSNMKDRKSVV